MASAVIGSLRVVLGIDTAIFDKGLADATKSLKSVGKSMQGIGRDMSLYLTAPIVGFGALTVKTAGDFEAAMNRVDAATGATTEEFKAMRDMAVQLGAETSFSASESADAMEMLAKNGLNTSQIMGGAVSASMKLAASSGSDLSSAADVATAVMMNFGKEAKDLGPLVDGITGVLLQSKMGFDDYRLAIGQAGGVAGNLGVSFEDFNAVIAATSSAFASGSDAGTSFKTFLTTLVPTSKPAEEMMKKLGLSFFEVDGSMKSMAAIAEELKTKMSGLSDESLNDAMKTMFGTDAMRTGIMLMKQGGEGIDAFRAKIGEASADEQAAARLKGFNGELEKLSGAFETLQIAIADSGLLAAVTAFVTQLASWVDVMAETNPALLEWGTIIAGLTAVIGPVVLVLGTLAAGIAAIGIPIAAVIAGITALTAAFVAFYPEISAFVTGAWASLTTAFETAVAKMEAVGTAAQELRDTAVKAIAEMVTSITDWLQNKLNAAFDSVKAGVDRVLGFFSFMGDEAVHHSIIPDMVMAIAGWMGRLPDLMGDPAEEAASGVTDAFGGIGDQIEGVFSGLGSSIAGLIKGTKSWRDVLADVVGQIAQLALSGLGKMGGFGGFLTSLLGGLVGFASGGTIMPGGTGGIDSQLVAFRKSPNERVDITKPGQTLNSGKGGIAGVRVFVDQDGNWQAKVEEIADGRAAGAVRAGISQYDKGMPARVGQVMERNG